MKDLIGKIVSAIATGEGYFAPGDDVPKRDNNPGDLRAAPWLPQPLIVGGFVRFPTANAGIAGEMHQVALDIARGRTLRQLLTKLTPAADGNNTENYINEAARRLGFGPADVDKPLWDFLEIEKIP